MKHRPYTDEHSSAMREERDPVKTPGPCDFSQYMKAGPLLKSSWLLTDGTMSVLVNTSKPSVRGLFAYGRMGRLHNLLYDLDCIALYSDLYGIYPSCEIHGRTVYPFRSGMDVRSAGSFDISGEKRVSVSPEETAISERITIGRSVCSQPEACTI